jgi:ribose 5-phosphate isomerase B
MKIAIASDHRGESLREEIIIFLKNNNINYVDFGPFNNETVDYPDFGSLVAQKISSGEIDKGILICKTGIGMSIVANKFPGVRAALVVDIDMARLCKEHNDANIIIFGEAIVDKELAKEMVKTWLGSKFLGGRHSIRLNKIREIERKVMKCQY